MPRASAGTQPAHDGRTRSARRVGLDLAGDALARGRLDRGGRQPLKEHPRLDEPVPDRGTDVVPVLLPAPHVLGDDEVVGLEAEAWA